MALFKMEKNLEDLRQRIRAEMEQISPDIVERSVQNVYTRVSECQMVGGGQFQHLR
jgi:vacuolar-type H+-ATPase subunit D/Vma8